MACCCSIPLGSCCCGIPIRLHWTFVAWLLLRILESWRDSNNVNWLLLNVILYGPILLITLIAHVMGHAMVNRLYGACLYINICYYLQLPVEEIMSHTCDTVCGQHEGSLAHAVLLFFAGGETHRIILWPLGGIMDFSQNVGLDVMEDFWVALAGPLTHIPMAGLWFLLWFFTHDPSLSFQQTSLDSPELWLAELAEGAIQLNAFLFVFNLFVPAYPLDGGRILAALLVKNGKPVRQAARITSITSMCIAPLVIAYGLFSFIVKSFRGPTGSGVLTFVIGIWIFFAGFRLYRLVLADKVLKHPLFCKPCYARDVERHTQVHDNINTGMQNETAESAKEKRGGGRFSSLFGKKSDETSAQEQAPACNIDTGMQNETADSAKEKRGGGRFSTLFGKKELDETAAQEQTPAYNINTGMQNEIADSAKEKRGGGKFSSLFGKKKLDETSAQEQTPESHV